MKLDHEQMAEVEKVIEELQCSGHDNLAFELVWSRAEIERLRGFLARYRDETPLGHQPHMIAHLVDEALGRVHASV